MIFGGLEYISGISLGRPDKGWTSVISTKLLKGPNWSLVAMVFKMAAHSSSVDKRLRSSSETFNWSTTELAGMFSDDFGHSKDSIRFKLVGRESMLNDEQIVSVVYTLKQ